MARKRRVSARVEAWYEAGYRWFRSESGAIVSTLEPGLLWPVKHVPIFNAKEVEENAKAWASYYRVPRSDSAERFFNLVWNLRRGDVVPGINRSVLPGTCVPNADSILCWYVAPPTSYVGEMTMNPFLFQVNWEGSVDETWHVPPFEYLPEMLIPYRDATIYWPSGKFVKETL